MQISSQDVKAVESLRDRIAEHRGAAARPRRYPTAIKKEALRLLDTGANAEDLGSELGIRPSLLDRWRRKRKGRPAGAGGAPTAPPPPAPPPRVLAVEPAKPASEVLLKLETGGFAVTVTRV